jgi:hypothetical protein
VGKNSRGRRDLEVLKEIFSHRNRVFKFSVGKKYGSRSYLEVFKEIFSHRNCDFSFLWEKNMEVQAI